MDRITARWVTLYVPNTFAAATRLERVERIPREKIRVIHNGLDCRAYVEVPKGRIRPGLGVWADQLVLACVANCVGAKGHEVLLNAVRALKGKGRPFSLWLVGDGSRRPAIEAQLGALGLGHDVRLLGRRNDVPDILADADIFVLASHWEGVPGAIMDAMASGLPVVAATRVGGIPELVVDGEPGTLVASGDAAALASSLHRFLGDPQRRREFGHAGRKRIAERFNLEDKVREQERLYLDLCKASP